MFAFFFVVKIFWHAGKSGGGPPHSKTLSRNPGTGGQRASVLECASPLALSGGRGAPDFPSAVRGLQPACFSARRDGDAGTFSAGGWAGVEAA